MPPAARVTDMHTCPMAEPGPVPHVGGPILPPGQPTVLINMLAAATVTNMATCVGPPDTIVKGSAGVFIGNLPAARMGDMTAHGGVIVMGSPNVIIGEIGSPSPGFGGLGGIVAGLVATIPPDQPSSWLSQFGKGLFDSTLAPLGQMIMHPIATAEGIGHAVAHPIDTAKAVGNAVVETGKGVLAGDPYAMGTALGTVGIAVIPGAGEAEAAEDAARLGKVGEISDAGLAARANAVHAAQDAFGQSKSTTAAALVRDANGNPVVMIGSSRSALTPAQRAALLPGEVPVTGIGHAETTIIDAAQSQGMTVEKMAASRPICDNCAQALRDADVTPVTPLKNPDWMPPSE